MELDLAYIAGFLDGDGSITALFVDQGCNRPRFDIRIYFFNQNLEVLLYIRDVLKSGILIHHPTGYSGCYRLDIPARDLNRVLPMLIPYLRCKKRQAELALLGRTTVNPHGGRYGVSDENQATREYVVNEIQRLNQKPGKDYKTNRVNSVNLSTLVKETETIPSQAAEGKGSAEGVTTSPVSPNNKQDHEDPTRKGKDSLTTTVM